MEERIREDQRLHWMSAEGLEILGSCFELKNETLEPGEVRGTAGRIGYLLQGEGSLQTDCGAELLRSGGVAGIRSGGSRGFQPAAGAFTALTPCNILWFPYDVMEFACHRNCWFHTRLILEIRRILEENG